MENLPAWLTIENVLIVAGILEVTIGAIPNNWLKHRSVILRAIRKIVEFFDELTV